MVSPFSAVRDVDASEAEGGKSPTGDHRADPIEELEHPEPGEDIGGVIRHPEGRQQVLHVAASVKRSPPYFT